ncbi:MAG: glycosyltransferase family 2 protein [Terriglobales bacterium]
MSTIPQISIITPSFNQATYIEETLRSVRNQECPSLEHIVVDGASTDGTVKILQRYSSMQGWQHLRWISEPDSGQCDALNKGFRMAKGNIIGWLNSDDRYEPHCFSQALKALETNQVVDFVYGDYVIIDETGKQLILKKEIDFDWDIMLCGLNYIAQPNVFFRRRIFDTLGYLNDSLHYVMDYEFWLRAASRGFRFQHIPSPFAACRWHLDAKTVSRNPRIYEELRSVREQYWNKRRFGNPSVQTAYQQYCNLRARVIRQWRKVQTRHVVDFVPASWYLEMWKTLRKPQTRVG